MSQHEQTLEWTFQYRSCPNGMFWANEFTQRAVLIILVLLITLPLLFLPVSYRPVISSMLESTHGIQNIFRIFIITVCILLLPFLLFGEPGSQKLRINKQVITLTTTNLFGTRERRMNTSGAKIRAVHFGFWERLFTFNQNKIMTAYHIDVFRSGETFLFPCVDETEQRQILAAIKEFGVGDVR